MSAMWSLEHCGCSSMPGVKVCRAMLSPQAGVRGLDYMTMSTSTILNTYTHGFATHLPRGPMTTRSPRQAPTRHGFLKSTSHCSATAQRVVLRKQQLLATAAGLCVWLEH